MTRLRDPDGSGHTFLHGDLEARYCAEVKQYNGLCQHPVKTRTLRGSNVVDQCKICGEQSGTPFKKLPGFESLPLFQDGLREEYQARRNEARLEIDRRYWAENAESKANLSATAEPLAKEYAAYLRTPEWQVKRLKVLKRANGICEGCLACEATEVHHKTYRHVQNELLFDLVALCRQCHEKAHPEKFDHDEFYEDFAVCASCRWVASGWCAKFEVDIYKAFQTSGMCFPAGAGFEPLK
ncbi:HNH endonuclease [Tabrizicola fusiformis]|uniref:HNH endonuclease n=1 Tax=Tabrizicola sp. SY72 TaxID=2741673 RepID=UPI001572F025|nr:HNH endonuclease signature motif containing protein [Tabrizicola sp. SY72]NTT88310.1 HNH endonuclease [Tabrizicola sp. SY72]